MLTVTDVNGNTATCSANVEIENDNPPVAICQDITIQLDANGDASITASDVDGGSTALAGIQDLSVDISAFDCSNIGDNTVILTVTDNLGDMATCSAIVTVEDNIIPTAIFHLCIIRIR